MNSILLIQNKMETKSTYTHFLVWLYLDISNVFKSTRVHTSLLDSVHVRAAILNVFKSL